MTALIPFLLLLPPSPADGKDPGRSDTLVVVCFGNSTTAPRKNVREVYPDRLQALMRNRGIPCRVENEGKGGSHAASISDNAFHRIPHGLDRFHTDVMRHRPDWLIVSFGINDSWQDKGRGTPSRIGRDRFAASLRHFVNAMDSIGGRTLILGPNPLGDKYEGYRKRRLNAYRRTARETARRESAGWIDKMPLFRRHARRNGRDIDSLLTDGMHPNDEGHALVAEAIFETITPHIKPLP